MLYLTFHGFLLLQLLLLAIFHSARGLLHLFLDERLGLLFQKFVQISLQLFYLLALVDLNERLWLLKLCLDQCGDFQNFL